MILLIFALGLGSLFLLLIADLIRSSESPAD